MPPLPKNSLTSASLNPFTGTCFSRAPPVALAGVSAISSFLAAAGAAAGVALCAALAAHTLLAGAGVAAGAAAPGFVAAAAAEEDEGLGEAFEDRDCGVRDAEGRGRAHAPLCCGFLLSVFVFDLVVCRG